jgi:hypothetical protein
MRSAGGNHAEQAGSSRINSLDGVAFAISAKVSPAARRLSASWRW